MEPRPPKHPLADMADRLAQAVKDAAEFLGPDGIADAIARLRYAGALSWLPGLILYPREIDGGDLPVDSPEWQFRDNMHKFNQFRKQLEGLAGQSLPTKKVWDAYRQMLRNPEGAEFMMRSLPMQRGNTLGERLMAQRRERDAFNAGEAELAGGPAWPRSSVFKRRERDAFNAGEAELAGGPAWPRSSVFKRRERDAFNAGEGELLLRMLDEAQRLEPTAIELAGGPALPRSSVFKRYAGGGALKRIAQHMNPEAPAAKLAHPTAVKEKGGNWGGVRLDQYIDDVADLQRRRPETKDWANNQLKRYIKTYLGTAEDPMLQVERDLPAPWFLDPVGLEHDLSTFGAPLRANRKDEWGKVNDAFHKAKTGRDTRTTWEQLADGLVEYPPTAGWQVDDVLMNLGMDISGAKSIGEALGLLSDEDALRAAGVIRSADDVRAYKEALEPYRWLDKLDSDTYVYDISAGPGDDPLGLGHILDYLDQTGYTADQMKRVTFPDAVRATTRWNQELAKKKAADPRYLLEGTSIRKEYPSGWKWVEVQSPEALKLEGDEMGHCVGGYCEAVRRGDTQILSLRDKEGRPHFTVEVSRPAPLLGDKLSQVLGNKLRNEHPGVMEAYQAWYDNSGKHSMDYAAAFPEWLKEHDKDLYEQLTARTGTRSIAQLKPAENTWNSAKVQGRMAKDPTYRDTIVPMVRDLVRTMGPWKEGARDLHNADMLDRSRFEWHNAPPELVDKAPQDLLSSVIRSAPETELPLYTTYDELLDFARSVPRRVRDAFNDTELATLKNKFGIDLSDVEQLTAGEIDDYQKMFKGD